MIRRTIAGLAAVAAFALLLGAAAPRAEAAVSFVDKQVQAGGLLIQNYIDKYGMAHAFVFPDKAMVKKGGGLPDSTLMWPANPWTGRTMGPGTARGTYTYALGAGGTSYKLTMHLSSGKYVFRGSMPRWLKVERDTATRQNLLLLQRYLEASAPNHLYPATGTFTKDANAGLIWPANAWTGQDMAAAATLGDYTYTQTKGGLGYVLTTRLSNGDTYSLPQLSLGALPLTTTP